MMFVNILPHQKFHCMVVNQSQSIFLKWHPHIFVMSFHSIHGTTEMTTTESKNQRNAFQLILLHACATTNQLYHYKIAQK